MLPVKHIRFFGLPFSLYLVLLGLLATAAAEGAEPVRSEAQVPVEELRLANGMTILLVPRPDSSTVAAGWMVQAGSADDLPGQTGLSHLLEHMMFKGSRTIGTRDIEKELVALAEVDRLWSDRRKLLAKVDSASEGKKPKLSQQIMALSAEFRDAQTAARSLAIQGQNSFLYSQQGATGLNANTYRDLTLYFVTLPSEKLEIWFWLESDRLLEPVFREFSKEVKVIHEERRQRIDSTPTGRLDEELRQRFWGDHPYSWNPMGQPENLDTLSRVDAIDFFQRHYRADKMTAVLVGGFDPQQVRTWAKRYFGRLPVPANSDTHDSTETVMERRQEQRWVATCRCPPQVKILYPSPRFGEPDGYALQLLSAVFNGRTGRLYRSLVVNQGIAFSAFTQQISWRQLGEFSFRAESKGSVDPSELVQAWDRQLTLLQSHVPTRAEIQRATNRTSADAFRAIKEPTALMKQLLIYQGLGDWRHINQWSHRVQEISSADLVQVAAKYLQPEKRTVAIFQRSEEPADP